MTMTPLDKVLALRPANAVSRLGPDCRIPVLNPRDLLSAIGNDVGLACIPAFTPSAIDGILRASREEDAVVGIACPHPLADREGAERFVARLISVGEEVRHRKPLFLQAGPFRVTSSDARSVDLLAGEVFRFVDAGFTLISVDASTLPIDEAVTVYRALTQSAVERELALEITAPLDEDRRTSAHLARALLETLAAQGVLVHFLRVPGFAYQLEAAPRESWQLDLSVLRAMAEVARANGAALSIDDESAAPDRLALTWRGAGVSKADPQEAVARIALAGLGPDRLAALHQASAEAGVPPRDLLASFDPARTADPRTRLRIEALTYGVTVDLIGAFGARGSASRAIDALANGRRG